jgi:hypothetical protein
VASIHAETTGDGEQIVLIAGGTGDPHDVALAARKLQTLTPLFTPSDPPGALLCPLTWPAVVQLSATFGEAFVPGTKLAHWITEQVRTRSNIPERLVYPVPEGLVPYYWQVSGAAMIASVGRVLITDEPGCIYGDAELVVNRGGAAKRMSLRDLVHKFNGGKSTDRWGHERYGWGLTKPTYVQREEDGVVRLARVLNAWCSGEKQTYTVTTESGRTIRATDEHPFLTERGWLRLDELQAGDLVHVRGEQRAAGRRVKQVYQEIAGLYGHPNARGLGRRTSRYRVAYHRLVAEAHMNGMEVEAYITMLRGVRTQSLSFLDPKVWAVHHKDHDPDNNDLSNLQVMTHSEHHQLHADEGKTAQVLYKVAHERVASVEPFGVEQTYDIEVADDPHNFIADGFVVHNTGKTVTTILGLVEHSLEHNTNGPILVVCPASVVDPWVEHFTTWAPHLTAVAWRGGKRKALMGHADVYVMSYEIAAKDNPVAGTKDMKPLVEMKPSALVVDECHYIKNPQAARSKAVRRLAKHIRKSSDGAVVGLSGTPITHGPSNLWPILEALEPLAWPAGERFKSRYCEIVQGDYKDDELGLNRFTEPEFRLTLLGQHRRVAKADVLADLPPKVYSTRTVQLPATWRKVYDDFEATMLAELPEDGGEMRVMDVLTKFNLLTRLASSAADVEYTLGPDVDEVSGELKRHIHLDLKAPSWKVDAMLEVLAERVPDRQQVVVFAPSAQLIRLAGAAAASEGYRVGYIIGGQSQGVRTQTVADFQAGKLDMVGVTTGAGGVGITLTAASTAVFLQRPWSLVESIQAEDRLHRIGAAHESIEIIDVIASNTIDTRIRAILRERAGQLADLVQDPRLAAELLGGTRLKVAS